MKERTEGEASMNHARGVDESQLAQEHQRECFQDEKEEQYG